MATPRIASCCTCAKLLHPPSPDTSTYDLCEKPLPHSPPRQLPCCARAICAACQTQNPRFQSYCPFCQVSTGASPLPQGLRDPPAYSSPRASPPPRDTKAPHDDEAADQPPSYASLAAGARDTVHHLHPDDTLASLSLAYGVPAHVLRQHNRLAADHLLSARRTIAVPATHYPRGVSLSPRPVESEAEREHKTTLRRFMVAAKCHEYDVAELYLRQAQGDLERALLRWQADEQWEREHPVQGKKKGPPRGFARRAGGAGAGLSGQLS